MSENLDQLRRDLAAAAPDSPEHARILDRIAVLVREAAIARRRGRVSEPTPNAGATRYVVVENTPGYLPESDDPATFDTWDEAFEYANALAEDAAAFVAEHDDTANVYRESANLWRITSDAPHALDRVVEILEEEPEQRTPAGGRVGDQTLVRVRDLEPRDILSGGVEVLGRPERRNRRVSVITENGVESWSEWAKVLVTKWYDRPDLRPHAPIR